MKAPIFALLPALLIACGGSTSDKAGAADDTAPEGVDDTGPAPLIPPSHEPCARLQAGAPAADAPAVALSALHATARFFGPALTAAEVDEALAAVLTDEADLEAPDLTAYAQLLPEACALPASSAALSPATVALNGDLAWVRPGTGAVALPAGAVAVAIDLRDLPDAEGLSEALVSAVSPALATPAAWPRARVRQWSGAVDQVFSESNVYSTRIATAGGEEIPATGAAELPLYVIVGERLPPAAARLALGLRAQGRAALVGWDLPAAVGELRWSAVGDAGVAVRTALLVDEDLNPLPDLFPADLETGDPEAALADRPRFELLAVEGPAERAALERHRPWGEPVTVSAEPGAARAALVTLHGTLRRFFPYFEVVGDRIDERLIETLPTLDEADRCSTVQALGRMANAIADGHAFFYDLAEDGACGAGRVGWLGITQDFIGGEMVVRWSATEGLEPGDVVLEIGDTVVADALSGRLAWFSGATPGYALNLASRGLLALEGDTTLRVRDPAGVERSLTVSPVSDEEMNALPWSASVRPSGTLEDLGHPELGYLNLDGGVESSTSALVGRIEALAAVEGLVVDMRGYPGVNAYTIAQKLIPADFSSPLFLTPTWTGPDALERVEEAYTFSAEEGAYAGPIVLLVHPTTVSAAENFATMLVAGRAVTVIGRQSAGTNGNITGIRLPGGFASTFTGMEVLFPDGAVFHGQGIRPDWEVAPTAADLEAGRDPELEAAIAFLAGG